MQNLSLKMQERLDKWRNNTQRVISSEKIRDQPVSRRNGKNDYSDALSLKEWEEEARKSQNRR